MRLHGSQLCLNLATESGLVYLPHSYLLYRPKKLKGVSVGRE